MHEESIDAMTQSRLTLSDPTSKVKVYVTRISRRVYMVKEPSCGSCYY